MASTADVIDGDAAGTVVVGSGPDRSEVRLANVYFAFGDGRFKYDCIQCESKCCRGHGYALQTGSELEQQLSSRPAVRFFVDPPTAGRTGGVQFVTNCAPACFFLGEHGLCSIHEKHGPSQKPETCRLFPFNYIRRVDGHLVVAPHMGLCPLQVVPPGTKSVDSSHFEILSEMSRRGLRAPVPLVQPICKPVQRLVDLERTIVADTERCPRPVQYSQFATSQLEATVDSGLADGHRYAGANLAEYEALVAAFLEIDGTRDGMDPGGALDDVLVAATPALRAHLVFRPVSSPMAVIDVDRVPYALVALRSLGSLAMLAGQSEFTFQTAVRLLSKYEALVSLLAHLDFGMLWRPSHVVSLAFPGSRREQRSYARIVRALLPASARSGGKPTLATVFNQSTDLSGVDRLLFLKAVALRLAGNVVPAGGWSASRRTRSEIRPRLRQWALGVLSDNVLDRIAFGESDRQAARARPS